MKSRYKEVLDLMRNNPKAIFLTTLLVILNAIITFSIPVCVSILLDKISNDNYKWLILIFIALSALIISLKYLLAFCKKKYSTHFRTELNLDIFSQLFKVKYSSLNEKGLMYYLETINIAVNNINNLLMNMLPHLISTIIMLTVSVLIIMKFSWPVASFLIVLIFLEWFVYKQINKVLSDKSVKLQQVCGRGFGYIISLLDNLDFLKSRSKYNGILKLLRDKVYDIHFTTEEVNVFAGNVSSLFNTFVEFSQYFLYLVFAYQALNKGNSFSQYVFLMIILNLFFNNLSLVSSISLRYSDAVASWQFIENEIVKEQETSGIVELKEINKIEFKNSRVAYDDNLLISYVNIELNKGDIIFIKGETGSGKSSLFKSLLNFIEPDNVYINGREYREYRLEDIKEKICYLSQNSALFDDNLENNIFIGEDLDRSKLLKSKFLSKFLDGEKIKNLLIQNKGGNLSGGDKQKILLARYLVRDYDLVILDEITSSMDSETETVVFDSLLMNNDDIKVIISHNDKLMKYADKVYQVRDKKLISVK